MEQKKCKCGQVVTGKHYCPIAEREVEYDDSSFLTSIVVGYATGSGLLGGLVGGSFVGGVVGAALSDDTVSTPDSPSDNPSSGGSSDDDSFGGGSCGGGGSGGDW